MIVDNLTKFNQKKKLWMTPKHPLYTKPSRYKILYGAVVFMQAELSDKVGPLDNFELERLLLSGFRLETGDMSKVIQSSKEKSIVIDQMLEEFTSDREKYLLMLDIINVSMYDLQVQEKEKPSPTVDDFINTKVNTHATTEMKRFSFDIRA